MPLPLATELQLTCSQTGQSITLVKQIATSGEAEVWRTNRTGYLAKLYHDIDFTKIRKLEIAIANPPQDPNAQINHTSFAWAKSLLKDPQGNCVGFLMPEIVDSVEIIDVYNPRRRQLVVPDFNWLYLHATAINIASIISAIHRAGYVLGDIKPQNILVNNQALASIIDTDSFQVKDPDNGAIYRCPVGSEGFTPPELLGEDLTTINQTEIHDRFRLGIIIYLLLFGDHPFKGKWMGKGDSPEPSELLKQGFWSHGVDKSIQPGPLTIPLDTVHPELQKCFQRCFTDGHARPELRPTAQRWFSTLQLAMKDLQVCRQNPRHYYSESYGKCYWCDRQKLLGVDIFPKELNWWEKQAKVLSNSFQRTARKTNVQAAKIQKQRLASIFNWEQLNKGKVASLKAKFNQIIRQPQLMAGLPNAIKAQKIGKLDWLAPIANADGAIPRTKFWIWGLASLFALLGLIIALINVVSNAETGELQWGSTIFAIAIGLGLLAMAGLLLRWNSGDR